MRKERGELHTLLLFSLRVRAMACFLWNRLSRRPVLSVCGIHGPRHSERHCRYNMMGTGFLVEVQEASLHHIAPSTRGAVESTWATFTPHRLKFLPSVLGARGFRSRGFSFSWKPPPPLQVAILSTYPVAFQRGEGDRGKESTFSSSDFWCLFYGNTIPSAQCSPIIFSLIDTCFR